MSLCSPVTGGLWQLAVTSTQLYQPTLKVILGLADWHLSDIIDRTVLAVQPDGLNTKYPVNTNLALSPNEQQ